MFQWGSIETLTIFDGSFIDKRPLLHLLLPKQFTISKITGPASFRSDIPLK